MTTRILHFRINIYSIDLVYFLAETKSVVFTLFIKVLVLLLIPFFIYVVFGNVLITQNQATAKNGLTISNSLKLRSQNNDTSTENQTATDGKHKHQLGTQSGGSGAYQNSNFYSKNIASDAYGAPYTYEDGSHYHKIYLRGSVSLGNGDAETRPDNFTIKVWVRTA